MYVNTFVILDLPINYIVEFVEFVEFVEDVYFLLQTVQTSAITLFFVSGLPLCESR